MTLLDALMLLAVVQAAGILVLAVLLFRKIHPLSKQQWVERERLLTKNVSMLKAELEASKKNERALRLSISRQQEKPHG